MPSPSLRAFAPLLCTLTAILLVALGLSVCAACRPGTSESGATRDLVVVASTTMLADLTRQLAPPSIVVTGIMEPGGDPHTYQPTPSDARHIASSDLVVRSGLHLEGWIDDLLDNAGGERPTVTASDGVEAIHMEGFAGGVDPHFWFDVGAWRIAAGNVSDALVAVVGDDVGAAEEIRRREVAYDAQLVALDAWVRQSLDTIPAGRRALVTSHDAFGYFGRAYGIDVYGVQGISTEQEASQRDVATMIDLVRSRDISAVFVETSVNPGLVQQIARETGAAVLGPLYSDSIGAADTAGGSYVGMIVENVRMIVEGLGGTWTPFAPPEAP